VQDSSYTPIRQLNALEIMSAKCEPNAKCSLSSNHRATITNILLYNKRTILPAPRHCDYCKWHVYRYRSILPPPPYPHHNSHSALSKYGTSFCRTLYLSVYLSSIRPSFPTAPCYFFLVNNIYTFCTCIQVLSSCQSD
jgi:hypothetical protein